MTEQDLRNKIYKKLNIPLVDDNIERLTLEQLEFITHDINIPCYLEACPGSGKTEVVGIKSAYELIDWKSKYVGLAIVSFTNNASIEIEKRAKKYAGPNATIYPHFIGTFDSFLYHYILCPFFHSIVDFKGKNGDCSPRMIIDERSDPDFLLNAKYQPKTRYAIPNPNKKPGADPYIGIPISANKYYLDVFKNDYIVLAPGKNSRDSKTLKDVLNRPEQIAYLKQKREEFLTNEIIYQGFKEAKKTFWRDGFLTFRDSEYIILKIIQKNQSICQNIVKRFPYLIIDECQDLSPMQLKILDNLVNEGLKVLFIGDLKQSIYRFREVDPLLITNFIKDKKIVNLKLSNNFRSNQKVVDVFCKVFPNSIIGNEKQILKNCLILIEYEENEISYLKNRYLEIIIQANTEAQKELIETTRSSIIIRGTTLLNKFRPFKSDSKSPLTILAISLKLWNIEKKNVEIMGNAISLLGCFLSKLFYNNEGTERNQYRQESISNAKWRVSLARLLTIISKELYPFNDSKGNSLSFSNWAIQVRHYLPILITILPVESYTEISNIKLQAEKGFGSVFVSEKVSHFGYKGNIRATTIHDIKGETIDSAMVVSSLDRKSKGGHWLDWFNPDPKTAEEYEHKRYGYVALSRPKHLLVLATPKLNPEDKDFFINLGFKIEDLKNNQTLF